MTDASATDDQSVHEAGDTDGSREPVEAEPRPAAATGLGLPHFDVRTVPVASGFGPASLPRVPSSHLLSACTVATRAELPALRVLAGSFLAWHPEARFAVLLIDAEPHEAGAGVVTPADIGVDEAELARLATAHTATELRAVLRPRLLERLLAEGDPVLYLDPWTLVLGPLTEHVLPAVTRSRLVLLPRALQPLPDDGLRPDAEELLVEGVYDPGLLAVAPGAESFLRAWAEQAHRSPESAASFLDGAPALVDHHVLRERGIGLSVWNAWQWRLERSENGEVLVDGAPLRTVHFAGFDPNRPWLLSAAVADRPRVLLSEHPVLAELCATYRADLLRAEYSQDTGEEYRFDRLPDGTLIPAALRARYRAAWQHAERTGGDPPPAAFVGDGGAFLSWAAAPADGVAGSTRWSAAVWQDDPALREQFPQPFGANAVAFRDWCAGVGVAAGRLRPELIPLARAAEPPLLDQLGVSVLGHGHLAELVRAAARASGLPTSELPHYPVVLDCGGSGALPADRVRIAYRLDGESTTVTTDPAFGGLDEVWVPSTSTAGWLRRADSPVVHVVPLPVLDPGERDEAAQAAAREVLGVPADAVVLACVADHAAERVGNALGAVSAFLSAFPDRPDALLLVCVSGAAEHPEAAERLRLATSADDRIRLVEGLSDSARRELFDAADCVISLHRGGPGGCADRATVVLAETAARGIPILASENETTIELIGTAVGVLVPSYSGGTEPDVQAAGALLGTLLEDRAAAAKLGLAGRERVLADHDVTKVADRVRERVEHAYRMWRARRSAPRPDQHADPLAALHAARHALLRQPDVGAASRIPMAPALRKAVLRALSHYDNHIREMLTTLIDGVERTAAELARRQEQLGADTGLAELDAMRGELERLAQRQAQLADQFDLADDGVIRVRADLGVMGRRVREAEDAVVSEAAARTTEVDALANRIDRLTSVLDRTVDRIDHLDQRVAEVLRERDRKLESGVRTASEALQIAQTLRRALVQEHERHNAAAPSVRSSIVLCDSGLLRLPAEDAVMLPLLSSNGVWEPELSALIDSLVEPGGVFLDIGAYVGYHTVRVLNLLGVSGGVVAVEPCATANTLLRHNVEVNVPEAIAQRLVVLDAAAWDQPGTLRVEPALTGGVAVRPGADPGDGADPGGGAPAGGDGEPQPASADAPAQPPADGTAATPADGAASAPADQSAEAAPSGQGRVVPAVRLDRELDKLGALGGMHLSVVRVAVPGGGHRALGGLVRLLRRDRPHVFCEFAPEATADLGDEPLVVLREFSTWGYDLVVVGGAEALSPEEVLAAIPRERTATVWLRPRGKGTQAGR